jgi:hypothetical protein
MTQRQRATCATSLVVSLGFVGLSLPTSSFAQAPTFGQPTISGIQGVGFEEDIRLDPTHPNRVYLSVPGSLSSGTSWIWHSEDGGKTFKWVTAAAAKEGKPNPSCAGGGDTELAVDSGGHLYFNDLTVLNFSGSRSDDNGRTFNCSNTAVIDAGVDRQWYAVDGDPTTSIDLLGMNNGAGHNLYLVNDEIGTGAVTCPVSGAVNNVVVMYRSPIPAGGATAGLLFLPAKKVSAPLSCDEGIMGNDEVSPVATTKDETPGSAPVKHVYVIHDDATFSRILIGRCFPVPVVSDPSGLSCKDLPVATLGTIPPGGTCPTAKTGANFPTMAIDTAGNLYAVWEQAPQDPTSCKIIGDTVLKYSFSIDEGDHWSTPITIPTPGLHNNVFAWPAAGDDGRVDIAFYGTDAAVPTAGSIACPNGGPDSVNGLWSLYMIQTLNGRADLPFTAPPVLAGEHYIHKGNIQTVIGGQCGDRTLGDFLQLRVGSHGEAQISYADSNNADEPFAPHGMYVKQNGGTGLFSSPVNGQPILLNAASDPAGDATRETDGVPSSTNIPNLDILFSSFSQPKQADCHPNSAPCYRVKMTVNDLTSLTPPAPDTVAVWLTQWLVPAAPGCVDPSPTIDSCKKGGKNPFVYFESNPSSTTPISCWSGENAAILIGGGAALTYPGTKPITFPGACSVEREPFGTITIDVPIADVSLPSGIAPLSNRLYSVTASTMTIAAVNAETKQPDKGLHTLVGGVSVLNSPIGGQLFDLIDVVRAYDFVPGAGGGGGGGGCHTADGKGDVPGSKGGKARFAMHEDDCNPQSDSEDFSDPSSATEFHGTQVDSVAYDTAAHTVTIAGLGTNNGLPVAFTIVAVDSSLVPPGLLGITLSDGYTNSGNLLDGSITLQ